MRTQPQSAQPFCLLALDCDWRAVAAMQRGRVWIGTSGYVYKDWGRGVFYPEGLPQSRWFQHYASCFQTVELNGPFYKLPQPAVFKHWYQTAGDGFQFFVKGSRFLSHMKKLKDPEEPLRRFFRAVRPLKEKLAGVLWQTPANFRVNPLRLGTFLRAFRRHSQTRLVMEFRDPSWFNAKIAGLLREFDAVYCRADAPEFYTPLSIPDTAGYVYYRRHGPSHTLDYAGGYSTNALKSDAREMRGFVRKTKVVFVYFNNDIGGHAPRDAQRLIRLVRR